MGRIYLILAIMMLFPMQYACAADSTPRLRNDGKVVNIQGDIIAVQNPSDPRNTAFAKYYTSLLPTGETSGKSDFYIILDKNAGYIQKDIEPDKPATDVAKNIDPTNPAPQGTQVVDNSKNVAANNNKTMLTLIYRPDMPVYNEYMKAENSSSLYGD